MSDESEHRYVGEIVAFAQWFDRLGRSVYGLLLLEIGWVLIIRMIKGLLPEDGASIAVPRYLNAWIKMHEISLTEIALAGTSVVAVGWIIYAYFETSFMAARWLWHKLLDLSRFVILMIAAFVNLVLFPICLMVEHIRVRVKMKSLRGEFAQQMSVKGQTAEQIEEARAKRVKDLEQTRVEGARRRCEIQAEVRQVDNHAVELGSFCRDADYRDAKPKARNPDRHRLNRTARPVQSSESRHTLGRLRAEIGTLAPVQRTRLVRITPLAYRLQARGLGAISLFLDGKYVEPEEKILWLKLHQSSHRRDEDDDPFGDKRVKKLFPADASRGLDGAVRSTTASDASAGIAERVGGPCSIRPLAIRR